MKIAFTICSNNYLAQAKTLGDSLLKSNPDYKFIIGLADKCSNLINYSEEIPFEVIYIENLGISDFESIQTKYNIIELNTCVKPVFFRYFFASYKVDFIFYFDPDIFIYGKLSELESKFIASDIILTPHILGPMQLSENRPNEYDFLNYGIYNIGFLGLKNSNQITEKFLPWWEERTLKLGFIKPEKGLFVDQIWFNIISLFFEKIFVLDHPGCNMAPWNLHERRLKLVNNKVIVNNKYELIFFHFSSYKYENPDTLFYNYERNIEWINEDLKFLYQEYYKHLIENKIGKYASISFFYFKANEGYCQNSLKRRTSLLGKAKRIIKVFIPDKIRIFLIKYI